MPKPQTTVVVRAFNEAKHLPDLFEGLKRQKHQDFEVVCVDSGSFDGSQEIARSYGHKVVEISSHDFTFGYSLNVGIRAADGQFIAIASAHTAPVDDLWLERLIAPLLQDGVAMVYGRQLGVTTSKFSEVEDFERLFGTSRRIQEHPDCFANNANSAIRKDLWAQQAFDVSLPGLEDVGWSKYWMERGYQTVYEPAAALYHIHEESWRQVRGRYHREAVAAHWIGIKGRRHALVHVAQELVWGLQDLAKAFRPGANPAAERLTLTQRLSEIVLFRINKGYGTISGLFDKTVLTDPAEREKMFFDRTGRAVVVQGPHKASLAEVEVPEIKPGDVLIHTAHVAVCATDREIYSGTLGYYNNGAASYPIVPGHEFSGFIAATGAKVSHLLEGDPVVVECIQSCGVCPECHRGNFIGCPERSEVGVLRRDGAYAEFVVSGARFVHKIPNGTDMRKAALCEPVAVVLKGLRRLQGVWPLMGRNDARCAVVGAGPLGHICAKILARQGCRVTSFDRSAQRLAFFSGSGIVTSQDLSTLNDFEAVIEVTGNQDALDGVLQNTAAGSAILLLGLPYGERPFSFETIAAYDKIVVGSVGSTRQDFIDAINLLDDLDLAAFMQDSVPLDQFKEAWEMSTRDDVLKVMIDVA